MYCPSCAKEFAHSQSICPECFGDLVASPQGTSVPAPVAPGEDAYQATKTRAAPLGTAAPSEPTPDPAAEYFERQARVAQDQNWKVDSMHPVRKAPVRPAPLATCRPPESGAPPAPVPVAEPRLPLATFRPPKPAPDPVTAPRVTRPESVMAYEAARRQERVLYAVAVVMLIACLAGGAWVLGRRGTALGASEPAMADKCLQEAQRLKSQGHFSESSSQAEIALDILVSQQPADLAMLRQVHEVLAADYVASQQFDKAIEHYRYLERTYPEESAYTDGLRQAEIRRGEAQLAAADEAAGQARNELANRNYLSAADYAQMALELYRANGGSAQQVANCQNLLGRACLANGNYEDAERYLALALKAMPNDSQVRAALAEARSHPRRVAMAGTRPRPRPVYSSPPPVPESVAPSASALPSGPSYPTYQRPRADEFYSDPAAPQMPVNQGRRRRRAGYAPGPGYPHGPDSPQDPAAPPRQPQVPAQIPQIPQQRPQIQPPQQRATIPTLRVPTSGIPGYNSDGEDWRNGTSSSNKIPGYDDTRNQGGGIPGYGR